MTPPPDPDPAPAATLPVAPTLSPDQADAWDALAETLAAAGVDLVAEEVRPATEGKGRVMAVLGKAGSGKTLLLAELTRALVAAGVHVVSGDYESKRRKDARTVAILAPTNKAAFVLRTRGVPATTTTRSCGWQTPRFSSAESTCRTISSVVFTIQT